jgi:hypothetical protein
MTGYLKSIETAAGQTIGLVRENGQIEDCQLVDPADVAGAATALRARYGIAVDVSVTFANSTLGSVGVIGEPGTFTDVNEGDRIFFPPGSCLVGVFHSGTPAPELGGIYLVEVKVDDELTVSRVSDLTTAAQFAAAALISVDAGAGAGFYQVATPNPVTVNTTPQVMPWLALPPPSDSSQYTLGVQSGKLQWQLGFINAP